MSCVVPGRGFGDGWGQETAVDRGFAVDPVHADPLDPPLSPDQPLKSCSFRTRVRLKMRVWILGLVVTDVWAVRGDDTDMGVKRLLCKAYG